MNSPLDFLTFNASSRGSSIGFVFVYLGGILFRPWSLSFCILCTLTFMLASMSSKPRGPFDALILFRLSSMPEVRPLSPPPPPATDELFLMGLIYWMSGSFETLLVLL